MSSRKRPLAEISQSHSTPARYAPSTPHALRALQQRSSAKQRSARSVRGQHNNITDTVRPDGSARNILRQFAKITAPVTKKRISTPTHNDNNNNVNDKENQNPDENEDDSVLLKKPAFTLEESIEEDDSELPVPPTPSVLPDDDDDDEEPTITFQDLTRFHGARPASETGSRRRSRISILSQGIDSIRGEQEDEHEGDATMMTERGRRAFSEEATGRLSRYSFGSIRMSDFGSELEVKRNSDRQKRLTERDVDDHLTNEYDDHIDLGGETENLRAFQHSPTGVLDADESVQLPGLGDETFNLEVPDDDEHDTLQLEDDILARSSAQLGVNGSLTLSEDQQPLQQSGDGDTIRPISPHPSPTRQQTPLETAATRTHTTRRKRVKLTRHGLVVPSLPTSLIKRIANETQTKLGRRKPALGRDHIKALEQATEWYFEQVGEDLAVYSSHGRRRKRIDTDDVLLLMRRQKVLLGEGELQKLAAEWLPKEVLQDLDLPEQP